MGKVRFWGVFLIVLGAGFAVLVTWSVRQAGRSGAARMDAEYVRERAEPITPARGGARVDTRLADGELRVWVRGDDGTPRPGLAGTLTLLVPAAVDLVFTLREEAPGEYRVSLPEGLTGAVPARLDLRGDGAALEQQLFLRPTVPERR